MHMITYNLNQEPVSNVAWKTAGQVNFNIGQIVYFWFCIMLFCVVETGSRLYLIDTPLSSPLQYLFVKYTK